MKNYTILLFPDQITINKIERFRIKTTGSALVDSLPPHITLKRRFTLKKSFSEKKLLSIFRNIKIPKFTVTFKTWDRFGDAKVWVGNSNKLVKKHISIVDDLEKYTDTQNPKWEKKGFKIHLTLIRGMIECEEINIKKISLVKAGLYEIGPSNKRNYAKKISLKILN